MTVYFEHLSNSVIEKKDIFHKIGFYIVLIESWLAIKIVLDLWGAEFSENNNPVNSGVFLLFRIFLLFSKLLLLTFTAPACLNFYLNVISNVWNGFSGCKNLVNLHFLVLQQH